MAGKIYTTAAGAGALLGVATQPLGGFSGKHITPLPPDFIARATRSSPGCWGGGVPPGTYPTRWEITWGPMECPMGYLPDFMGPPPPPPRLDSIGHTKQPGLLGRGCPIEYLSDPMMLHGRPHERPHGAQWSVPWCTYPTPWDAPPPPHTPTLQHLPHEAGRAAGAGGGCPNCIVRSWRTRVQPGGSRTAASST